MQLLIAEGALEYSQTQATQFTAKALDSLAKANPIDPAGSELYEITTKLLERRS